MPKIYPIVVDNDEMQELFDILNKYQDTILQMAKVVGGDAATAYNRAVTIINGVLESADESVSPPKCISKDCIQSDYCYKPGQCEFVKAIKNGFSVVRTSEAMLPVYQAVGWKIHHVEDNLSASSKKYLLIYPK